MPPSRRNLQIKRSLRAAPRHKNTHFTTHVTKIIPHTEHVVNHIQNTHQADKIIREKIKNINNDICLCDE